MHLTQKEHNPPHIHAIYGESGSELVKKFILKYQKELQEMWDTEIYKKLPPID